MNFAAGSGRARRPALTPMIDVVFLLLVFFILVARFGTDQALDLAFGSGGGLEEGPPSLIDVGETNLRLNGVAIEPDALGEGLLALGLEKDATLFVRPTEGVDLQRLVDVIHRLESEGHSAVAIVEAKR